MKVKQKETSFLEVEMMIESGWEQTFLLTSDWHFDNPKCKRDLLFRHLDQAKEKDASVFCFGDLFCAMQGVKDRRGSKSGLRREHMGDNYFDLIVTEAAEKLEPYKDSLILLGLGNHETAILKHNEINLLDRLAFTLNHTGDKKSDIKIGGYGGYVKFNFIHKTGNKKRYSVIMKYHHGSGGASPVTKGAISQQRAAVLYPSADIVVSGHIHQLQNTVFQQEVVNNLGNVKQRRQVHLRTSTYKDSWGKGEHGWEVEKGFGPSPLGGWWLTFSFKNNAIHWTYNPTDW